MIKSYLPSLLIAITILMGLQLSSCVSEGCTDPEATNYDEDVEDDDGSCEYDAPIVIYCDSARTRELVDDAVNTPLQVFVNDVNVGTLNYFNYPRTTPDCNSNFSNSTFEEVLQHTQTIFSKSEVVEVRLEDNNGNVITRNASLSANSCTAFRI